jgi:hypothetical protein
MSTAGMTMREKLRHYLPKINFVIALTALGFQTMMLYPWHHELDREFKLLKADQDARFKSIQLLLTGAIDQSKKESAVKPQ